MLTKNFGKNCGGENPLAHYSGLFSVAREVVYSLIPTLGTDDPETVAEAATEFGLTEEEIIVALSGIER